MIEPPPLEDFEPSNDIEEMALALAIAGVVDDAYDGPGIVMDFKSAEMVVEALGERGLRLLRAAADRAEREPEWEWDHNHPISRRPPLAAVQEKCPACIVGNAKRRAGDIAAPHIAADRAERGLPLDAMARDLADVVRRAPDAFCDLSGARHADLVERRVILAALAADPQSPTGEGS